MSDTKDMGKAVKQQARKAEDFVDTATAKARTTIDEVGDRIGEAADSVQEKLQKTGKEAAAVVSNVSDRMRSSADYMREQGLPSIIEDVETLIKRYPTYAVLIGIGIGFLLARRGQDSMNG